MLIFKVAVPQKAFDGIKAVRISGRTNMLDLPEVIKTARELGYPDAASWIENNKSRYIAGIFQGFWLVKRSVI